MGLTARGDVDVSVSAARPSRTDAMEEAARWVTGPDRASRGRGHLAYVPDHRTAATSITPGQRLPSPTPPPGALPPGLQCRWTTRTVLGDTPRVGLLVAPRR
ncbi:MAG: hypothetical protein R2882_12765 [Gemmatimonadales bacterium]